MPTKIIDIHPHIISADTKRYPINPLGGKQSVWSRERPVTFEQMIRAWTTQGSTNRPLFTPPLPIGYDNSYLADCVALQPKRFTGVFSVDMLAADAPEKIRYWVGRRLSGLRLFTAGSTMEKQSTLLDDPRSFPGWECAGDLGIPVCVQLLPDGLPQLMVLIKRFSKIRIIIDHLLWVPLEEASLHRVVVPVRSRPLRQHPSEADTNNVRASTKGKATPETFFPSTGKGIWRVPYRLGFELSGIGRNASSDGQGSQGSARRIAATGPGMDPLPHGPGPVSGPCGQMKRSKTYEQQS